MWSAQRVLTMSCRDSVCRSGSCTVREVHPRLQIVCWRAHSRDDGRALNVMNYS